MSRFVLLLLAAAASALSPATVEAAGKATFERGRRIAKENCGRCHAIGRIDASPNPKSPPFRTLSRRYPLANLEEALGEGIVVGHEGLEMPQYRLDTAQIEALLAYLNSIQRK